MTYSGDELEKRMRSGTDAVHSILNRDSGDTSFALVHYGVKGMHWGVRKKDDTGGSSSGNYKPPAKPKPKSQKEAAANLAENEKKFQDKFNDSSAEPKKQSFISKHKKGLITIGAYAAIVGAFYVAGKRFEAKNLESIDSFRGKEISAEKFASHVSYSKAQTWMANDYMKQSAFDREEFSLPAGHTFHRISKAAETSFHNAGTYATHSEEDYHRYIAQFRQEKGGADLHHVTWQANEEIKVPSLRTVLDTLKEAVHSDSSDDEVVGHYQKMSGGSWSDAKAQKLFDGLRQKGYGAIVDEMDAGVIGETPLVVFAHALMGKKSSEPITQDDIKYAESNLVEMMNRKI